MTARTKPPFRADHVGSLLRPPEVHQARADFEAGKLPAAELRAIEDSAIREAVKLQEDLGYQGVTDGEFRRQTFHMDFYQQIGGLAPTTEKGHLEFRNDAGVAVDLSITSVRMTGKLHLRHTIFGDDFTFLKNATKNTAKTTIPAPSILHRRAANFIDRKIYPDMEQFWVDLAQVYRDEIARLGALGCTYLQVDDTSFATLCDPAQRAAMTKAGIDGERVHETYIEIFNDCMKNKPADMSISTHTCRGNFRSSWFASGGYEFIAEKLFGELDVDGFFLEFDDARSGGFEPLRFVPRGKIVVLGLVSSKLPALESKDQVKRRIDEAAKFLPLDQLCLSPQCGFSSTVEGNALTFDQQRAKLKLVTDVAREVWG